MTHPAEAARAPALVTLLAILASALPAAAAAADGFEAQRAACAASHPEDRAALALCLQDAALAANLRVDERYFALREDLRGDSARRLLTAQRAFVRFRDLHCTAIGRSVDNVAWQACNLRLTLDRLAQLERYPEP
jgi:uncharacterized protein YecT (DUF1311 family)